MAASACAQLVVRSPDGRLALTFDTTGGRLAYSVAFQGKPVIDRSALALELKGQAAPLGGQVRVVEAIKEAILAKRGAKTVLVANRSVERAEKLALEFGGRAVRLEDSAAAMTEADILVSSTGSPDIVLRREDVAKILPARGNRPLVLVDIAVPRDIDPAVSELPNVFLYDIDDLEAVVRENTKNREAELAMCRQIIAAYSAELMGKFASPSAKPVRDAVRTVPGWALDGATA